MSLTTVVVFLLIAGGCGAVGSSLGGYSDAGCFSSVALGLVGAILGLWLAQALALPTLFSLDIGGTNFPVVWSVAGAALFVALLGALRRLAR